MKDLNNLKDANKSRRKLVKKIVKFLPVLTGGALLYPLSKYLNYSQNKKISYAIPLEQIDNNVIKKDRTLIVKHKEKIVVFSAKCTHMGCLLNIDLKNKKFVCPCHSSEFSFSGKRLKGPAKRDLDILRVKIENKILYIG